MLPNDFIVLWELSSSPTRYVKQVDGSWDLMVRAHGKWEFFGKIPDNVAARAFHEAESVYAVVDRSPPKAEELPVIPSGVYWNESSDNFYDATTKRGMGGSFFTKWHAHKSKFLQCNNFGNEEKQ